jgi:lipopolysaccharide export system protein LptA
VRRALWGLLAALLLSLAIADEASTLPFFELKRSGRTITVQQTAPDAKGGIFASRKGCDPKAQDMTLTTVYAPDPYLVHVNVNDTRITANIALRTQPSGDQDKAVLKMFGGTLKFNEQTYCPEDIEKSGKAGVTVLQGRTAIAGVEFDYDNSTGLGTLAGPITLERKAQGNSPSLSASADSLEFNVDKNTTVLRGNVKVTSQDRVSTADTVEYDDKKGLATLRGHPARSQKGDNIITGSVIHYDLNTNDVVAEGSIGGTFTLESGGASVK